MVVLPWCLMVAVVGAQQHLARAGHVEAAQTPDLSSAEISHASGQISHDHAGLQATLDFVAMTLNNSLTEHGGEAFKIMQTDSAVQDQIKALAAFVKVQLVEIDGSMQDVASKSGNSSGHVVRRQSPRDAAFSVDLGHSLADSSTRGLLRSVKFAAETLKHSLDIFGGAAYKRLLSNTAAQKQLYQLADSVEVKVHGISDNMLMSQDMKYLTAAFLAVTIGMFLWLLFEFSTNGKFLWLVGMGAVEILMLSIFLFVNLPYSSHEPNPK